MRRTLLALVFALPAAWAQGIPVLSVEQQETFLEKATLKVAHAAKKGVTGTIRATMTDGATTHDASIQTIDETKAKFEGLTGTEFNFQDSYMLNLAGYRLGRMLGLESMIPVSVERSYQGKKASYTWWIDDIQMDEVDRLKKKIAAPDKDRWSRQYLIMKVFDQLIYNMDRNATNMLYDKNWNLWMIDHSRSFRMHEKISDAKSMEKCDRELLVRLKALNEADIKREMGRWLNKTQIKSLIARRNLIVAHFEKLGPDRLYEFLPAK